VASSGVVPALDVVVDRTGEFDAGLPALAVQQLDLHPRPERLDHRIIERDADGTNGRRQPSVGDLLAECPGTELRSLIGVDDRLVAGCAAGECHTERVGNQQRGLGAIDRPADDHPGEGVKDRAAVDLALPGRVLSYVRHPEAIRRVS
jgi:hypothetical protein